MCGVPVDMQGDDGGRSSHSSFESDDPSSEAQSKSSAKVSVSTRSRRTTHDFCLSIIAILAPSHLVLERDRMVMSADGLYVERMDANSPASTQNRCYRHRGANSVVPVL